MDGESLSTMDGKRCGARMENILEQRMENILEQGWTIFLEKLLITEPDAHGPMGQLTHDSQCTTLQFKIDI